MFRARLTLPHFLEVQNDGAGGVKVVATQTIRAKTRLGPFEARRTTQEIDLGDGFILKVGCDCQYVPCDGILKCLMPPAVVDSAMYHMAVHCCTSIFIRFETGIPYSVLRLQLTILDASKTMSKSHQ